MKKSDELQKAIDGLKSEIEALQQNEQYKDAAKMSKDLMDLMYQQQTAKAMEAMDMATVAKQGTVLTARTTPDNVLRNRIFNKQLFGRALNDEEREYLNAVGSPGQVEGIDSKGGYLVPEEQISRLREYRKAYTALKDFAHVQTAGSTSGKMPTLGDEAGTLTKFEELNAIKESDFDFGQISYQVYDYGDIIPVSNQLLQDSDIELMSIIGQRFARKAVNTENKEIIDLLSTLTPVEITSYKGFTKALNVDLDPAYYANTRILTNQDGFQWLSELEDSQKRPLLVPDVTAPDTYRFKGKQIIVVSNNTLESSGSTAPFIIGSIADYVAFFERKGVEVAVSTEYMFNKYATALRCVERFGVVADDRDAVKRYYVTLA